MQSMLASVSGSVDEPYLIKKHLLEDVVLVFDFLFCLSLIFRADFSNS